MKAKIKTNEQFMILSAIGIIIVVICHLSGEIFRFVKIFPFITLFVFISGYFYKEQNEEKILHYIFYKFKKLMIPFFIINLVYGIIVNVLKHFDIINYGANITLYTMFVQPFINNSQYIFNFPAYFVPTIFLTNTCYAIIHKITRKIKILKEELLLDIFIILHILSIYFQSNATDYNFNVIWLRIMFFLPFFQFGYLYKKKWQKYDDKIPTIPYLFMLIGINFAFFKLLGNLNYDMHEFADFQSKYLFIPLITSIVGILFYTRIARVLGKWLGKNRIVNYISNNTFAIMTHHLFVSFLISFILYEINLNVEPLPYFDIERFRTGWIYIYETPTHNILFQLAYAILGIAGALVIQYIYDIIKIKILKITNYYKKEFNIV